MRNAYFCTLFFMLTSLRMNAQQVDFWRVREGSAVTLVLGTGGECRGRVVTRVEGSLSIKLSEASPACGARDALVTARESNTRAVERDVKRVSKKGRALAAIGLAAATGLAITAVPPKASLAVLGGGGIATRMLVKDAEKDGTSTKGYVIYVSRIDKPPGD
jgi:hypothetical protein